MAPGPARPRASRRTRPSAPTAGATQVRNRPASRPGSRPGSRSAARSAATAAALAVERTREIGLERRRLLALWLLVLVATLAWLPGGFTRFVFPKLLVVALACLLGATLPAAGRLPRRVTAALLAGAGVLTLAAVLGQTPVASLIGRWPRYEGLPVLGLYVGSAWLGARLVGRGPTRAVHLAHALAGLALVLFGFSLLDALGHSPLGASSLARSGSLLGNATDQGLVAMMAAVVVAAVAVDRADLFLLAGGIAAVATVALSASRIALALTAVGVVAAALRRHVDRRTLLGAGGGVVAMAAMALGVPATRGRLLDTATGSGRLTQWRDTLGLVGDHPWLGLGPSRYVDAFGTHESAAFVRFAGSGTFADSPHDLVLQTAVAGGLPLVACLVVLVYLLVRRGLAVVAAHPEAWGPALAAAAYGVAMLANFTAAGSTCLAAFLAGAVIAEPVAARAGTDTDTDAEARGRLEAWRGRLTVPVFAVAAVVMAMSCVSEVELAHGVAAAASGDADLARHDIDAAHAWRPLDGDVAMLGSQAMAVLADGGHHRPGRDTVALADQALARTPSSYAARVALAVGLITGRHLTRARAVLDAAVASFPHRPDAYVQRCIARLGLGDLTGARADLDAAARIEPRSPVIARLRQVLAHPPSQRGKGRGGSRSAGVGQPGSDR